MTKQELQQAIEAFVNERKAVIGTHAAMDDAGEAFAAARRRVACDRPPPWRLGPYLTRDPIARQGR